MAVIREKPWTIEELAEWLGYPNGTARALDVVREQGVPYFWVGPRGKKFGEPGSHKYLRFLPGKVEAWAATMSVGHEPGPEPKAPERPEAAPKAAQGWKASDSPPKLRGPRA